VGEELGQSLRFAVSIQIRKSGLFSNYHMLTIVASLLFGNPKTLPHMTQKTTSESEELKRIARYTAHTRKRGGAEMLPPSRWSRFQLEVESLSKKLIYGVLGSLFRDPPLTAKIPIQELDNLLIFPYGDSIGDLIVTEPIWRAIKSRNPNCRIGVVTSIRNEGLLAGDSRVDVCYHFNGRSDLKHLSELRQMRKGKYQLILNLHFNHLSDYGLFANIAGRKAIKATGNRPNHELYEIYFNHFGTRPRHTSHLALLNLELLNEVVECTPPLKVSDAFPRIRILDVIQKAIDQKLATILQIPRSRVVLINLQARNAFREWTIERNGELARLLCLYDPTLVVLFNCAPAMQTAFKSSLAPFLNERIQFFETGSDLLELAALVKRSSVVLTPETSLTQFCSAVETPVVVMLPDREKILAEWLPLGIPARILAPMRRGDPVATLSVSEVFEAVRSLLDKSYTATQTYLDPNAAQSMIYQQTYGARLLEDVSSIIFDPNVR
jgi:ADP-heptose:LPS heptosyltransferase